MERIRWGLALFLIASHALAGQVFRVGNQFVAYDGPDSIARNILVRFLDDPESYFATRTRADSSPPSTEILEAVTYLTPIASKKVIAFGNGMEQINYRVAGSREPSGIRQESAPVLASPGLGVMPTAQTCDQKIGAQESKIFDMVVALETAAHHRCEARAATRAGWDLSQADSFSQKLVAASTMAGELSRQIEHSLSELEGSCRSGSLSLTRAYYERATEIVFDEGCDELTGSLYFFETTPN